MSNSRAAHTLLMSNVSTSLSRSLRTSNGPKAPSMTSGRGWPSTGRDHHQAVSASVMDGGFAGSDGGVR